MSVDRKRDTRAKPGSRPLRCRALLAIWSISGAAFAAVDVAVEERMDESRAAPTPVAKASSWVIVPIPVSNPTVGTGLQVTVLYLHAKKAGEEESPGATSGLGVMATESGSRLVGAFHDASFAKDRFRLSAYFGLGQLNLKYYGGDQAFLLGGHSLRYRLNGAVGQVRGEVRVPGSVHWFAGLTYLLMESSVTFKTSDLLPGVPDLSGDFRSAGMGPHVSYDSRDSNFFPVQGQQFRARWLNYAPRWGSDFSYDKVDVFYNHYTPVAPRAVVALRTRLQSASDGTPFFDLPYLDMRGFARDRYQSRNTLSVSADWRYMFAPRWGVAAFAEVGRFAPTLKALSDGRTITSYGGGVRWKATAERELNLGLDFAISTDDKAVFIQIGERF